MDPALPSGTTVASITGSAWLSMAARTFSLSASQLRSTCSPVRRRPATIRRSPESSEQPWISSPRDEPASAPAAVVVGAAQPDQTEDRVYGFLPVASGHRARGHLRR